VVAIAVLIAVRVLAVDSALHSGNAKADGSMLRYDARRYHAIAESHGRPYRDFEVEFPPVTLAAIEATNGSTVTATMSHLAWSQVVADLLVAAALAYGWGRRHAIAYLVLGVPFLIYPFVYLRIDLFSVALAVSALALVRRGREASGGALLAAAVLAKLWPLALVPLLVVERRVRALVAWCATSVVGLALWVAWGGTDGPVQVLTFRGARGWQIESVAGALVRTLGGAPIFYDAGAMRTGDVPAWARALLGLGLLSVVAGAWYLAWRRRDARSPSTYAVASLTAVGAFLVFSPILSPQYLIWLLPFAAIAAVDGERRPALVFSIAWLLTLSYVINGKKLFEFDAATKLIVLGRNGCLVGLVALGLYLLWSPRSADAGRGRGSGTAGRGADVTVR